MILHRTSRYGKYVMTVHTEWADPTRFRVTVYRIDVAPPKQVYIYQNDFPGCDVEVDFDQFQIIISHRHHFERSEKGEFSYSVLISLDFSE